MVPGVGSQRIRWYVTEAAQAQVAEVREIRDETGYFADVRNLREFLGGYFDASSGCTLKQGRSVSPVGSVGNGKILKVRWIYPGAGKSGGLRLCFVAFCEQRKVVLCHAEVRRDVDDDELIASAGDASVYVDDESG